MMQDQTLSGCQVLIVEDDYYQAHDYKQLLEEAGATVVGVTASVPDLDSLLARVSIDVGLIDINLGGSLSLDFARGLRERAIPFMFVTGYDAAMLPDDLSDVPCISKPADHVRILTELARTAASGR
jgi:CheY-like chemotaxis protein